MNYSGSKNCHITYGISKKNSEPIVIGIEDLSPPSLTWLYSACPEYREEGSRYLFR
jgi:hypothetical protein